MGAESGPDRLTLNTVAVMSPHLIVCMEILTRRFLLRDFVEADRPAFLAYQADPRARAFYGPDEASQEDTANLFETFRAWSWECPRLNYQLAIVQRAGPHALVGCCGLRRGTAEPGGAELGLELAPDYWGHYGYAVEVGRALLDFGFAKLGLTAVSGSTVSANNRVQRLAEWFGAEVESVRPGPAWMEDRGWSEVGWRITRDQWMSHTAV